MKVIKIIFIFVSILAIASCGTILKPDQISKPTSKQLDYTIVLLDSLGLFLIVPGIVALIVDYSNGTLYLPRGEVLN